MKLCPVCKYRECGDGAARCKLCHERARNRKSMAEAVAAAALRQGDPDPAARLMRVMAHADRVAMEEPMHVESDRVAEATWKAMTQRQVA